MRTKNIANEQKQRERLLRAAWALFREKGYVNTTMEDILRAADCSKGRFYYYYRSKSELLEHLHRLFDEKYMEADESLPPSLSAIDRLVEIDRFMYRFAEQEIGCELLSQLYIAQLSHAAGVDFRNDDDAYPRIVRKITQDGQLRGELRGDLSSRDMADAILGVERSILFNWCLSHGTFSLSEAGPSSLKVYLLIFRAHE